jgi:hypothetical protein
MKSIKNFKGFLNESFSSLEDKYKTFIQIYNELWGGEDWINQLKYILELEGITVVLFSELKKYKSFPENSIIFTNEDPNDFYVFSKDLDSNVEFSNFNEYKEIYASRKKEAAFIF